MFWIIGIAAIGALVLIIIIAHGFPTYSLYEKKEENIEVITKITGRSLELSDKGNMILRLGFIGDQWVYYDNDGNSVNIDYDSFFDSNGHTFKVVSNTLYRNIETGALALAVALTIGVAIYEFGSFFTPNVESIISNIGESDTKTVEEVEDENIESENLVYAPTLSLRSAPGLVAKMESVMSDANYDSSIVEPNKTIAVGVDGKYYDAADLVNRRVCVYFEGENGEDCFFAGQYDEDNRWNGDCLINVYKDGALTYTSRAVYQAGYRIEVYQAYLDGDGWIVSRRELRGETNTGDTWMYEDYPTIRAYIDRDKPVEDNMVEPEEVNSGYLKNIRFHYNGNEENGLFSDRTGDAYYIGFFDDGTVRTLYVGTFIRGDFDYGWEIAKAPDTSYMYFRGKFINNAASSSSGDMEEFINPISIDAMNELIADLPFRDEIRWQVGE